MNVRRLIPTTAVAGAVGLGLMAVTACSTSDAAERTDDGRLKVVASFYPMQYLAERIGGANVSVTTLTKPGVEPHDLDLKPRQTAELNDSGFILYLKGVQPAIDKAIGQATVEHKVDAAELTTMESFGDGGGHDHSHEEGEPSHDEGDAHGHEEGHDEAGAEAGHEGHDHAAEGGADPHIWLDPSKYAEVAKGVGSRMEEADPDHAAEYKKNTEALVAELTALDKDFEQGLKNSSTRTFITTHSAFGYLAERYGLEQEGISGIAPESEPSPARIKELQTIAEKDKVTTVFFETLASDRTAKTLAKDTGLKTDVLDPLEGITDTSRGDDYVEVMRSNLAALQKALGAK
ncbi:metal ABC transporter substrate-binding protein [Streptomyces sp. t39]|uniref:metal ABC transporter substrate-binding protein n=1 Tax=Streptomyces sp. t39 TaxID=1828156 RepID=UPI0011CE10C7|nr:metal ABC transporter substrate-binding protein [Streptomyces sp. t39]TXS55069.1 zinc ABC transporter substrate-binding protein [Streptomyces sp. t39]